LFALSNIHHHCGFVFQRIEMSTSLRRDHNDECRVVQLGSDSERRIRIVC
jgi:hypothetical protein